MKKKIVIYATVSITSARQLAKEFNERTFDECTARVVNPYKVNPNVSQGEIILSYGCSSSDKTRYGNKRINTSDAVMNCIDKIKTFSILKFNKISTVNFVTRWDKVPKEWDYVVVRDTPTDRKGNGMNTVPSNEVNKYKHAQLFTEFFTHKFEYRITVFMGKVVGRYYKREFDGEWELRVQPSNGFEEMDKQCIKAAKALGIDYVGFDVVANTKKDFRILEANSGPILTGEAGTAILEHFLNLES